MRSRSRSNISTYASKWWPKVTGCATCMCVNPGITVAACRSANSTSACCSARCGNDSIDLAAQPKPSVGGDLVVARAAGVQPLAGVADQFGQALFDVEVYVFEFELPRELALDLFADLLQSALDRREIILGDDPRAASIAAWASDPSISAKARRWSKLTDAV